MRYFMAQNRLHLLSLCAIAVSVALVGCGGDKKESAQTAPATQQAPTAKEVGVLVAQSQPIENKVELAGRVSAYETSEVRPQATGVIMKQFFQEGSFVKAGQPLYQLDNRTNYATAENAQATVNRHIANVNALRVKEQRYRQLVGTNAISKQDYDDVLASLRLAEADLKASQASLESAKVSLQFSTITAPISGRTGRSNVTVGALVQTGQADALVTIQRLDPVYIDINQSSADWLRLRQQINSGSLGRSGNYTAQLKMEDGSIYPHQGQLTFAGASVNESTGTITFRAIFPNPQQLLLPGMYATAQVTQGVIERAYLVPQTAVTRNATGQATVLVVGNDSKLVSRTVTTKGSQGSDWIITEGLSDGDKVVVQGNAKVKEGDLVKAKVAGAETATETAPAQTQTTPPLATKEVNADSATSADSKPAEQETTSAPESSSPEQAEDKANASTSTQSSSN